MNEDYIEINIIGDPVPKGRARAYRKSRGIGMKTPKKTKNAENIIRNEAIKAMNGNAPTTDAVSVQLLYYVPIPKTSMIKREKAIKGAILPVTRPDLDNYVKLALDAVNGVVWKDDNQVTDMTVSKRYGDQTGFIMRITRLESEKI